MLPPKHDLPSARDIALVRESFARIVPIKDVAADLFYDHLFGVAPHLRAMFPADMVGQKRKLVAMLGTAVNGLSDLGALVPAVKALGARHVGYGTKPVHYAIVGQALLWTLERGLGAAFTPDVKAAWTKVYGLIAATMQAGAAEVAMLQAAE
jgi:hemoglobin-like flavoprotein